MRGESSVLRRTGSARSSARMFWGREESHGFRSTLGRSSRGCCHGMHHACTSPQALSMQALLLQSQFTCSEPSGSDDEDEFRASTSCLLPLAPSGLRGEGASVPADRLASNLFEFC